MIDAEKIGFSNDSYSIKTDPSSDAVISRDNSGQEQFIEEFLKFYSAEVLSEGESFHYETFYDYYKELHYYYLSLLAEKPSSLDNYTAFVERFRSSHRIDTADLQLLYHFDLAFNQFIAGLLSKNLGTSYLLKPYGKEYQAFLQLVEVLGKNYTVHFHTLNHDVYLERLSFSQSMRGELDDGFEELGSPFYGELQYCHEAYKVRLERFEDRYESCFRLYKLHGSIDYYATPDQADLVKLKRKSSINRDTILKEVLDQKNLKSSYDRLGMETQPRFLSGTTAKLGGYSKGVYYPKVLEHFKQNLEQSNTLVVIGYGFGDTKINEHIETSFFGNGRKQMFVVDVSKPDTHLLQRENVHYLGGGVTGMDTRRILQSLTQHELR
ncbi:MAG: hypothetical protein ACR2GR_05415 [Rhodothermales bacterium]